MSVNKLLTRAEHFLDSYLNKTQRIIFGVKYEEMCGDYPDQYRVHIEEKCSSTFHKIFIDETKHTTDDDEYGTITVHAPFTEVVFLCTADKRSCILAVPYSERDDRLYHCYDCISDETVLITFIEKIKGGDIKFFVNDNAPNNSFEIKENRDSSVIRFSKTIKFRLEN